MEKKKEFQLEKKKNFYLKKKKKKKKLFSYIEHSSHKQLVLSTLFILQANNLHLLLV